jgi:hypothetical protein
MVKVVEKLRIICRYLMDMHSMLIHKKRSEILIKITKPHWEELLQSVSNFIFRLIISKHCGRTPRGVKGVKRSEIC